MILDTYRAIEQLVSVGIKKEHAVAFTDLLKDQNSTLATKADIDLVKKDLVSVEDKLKSEIQLVKKDVEYIKEQMATKSDMEKMQYNILKWVVGSYIVTAVTIIFSSPIVKVIQQYSL